MCRRKALNWYKAAHGTTLPSASETAHRQHLDNRQGHASAWHTKHIGYCSKWHKQGSQSVWKAKGETVHCWRFISSKLLKPRCSYSSTRLMPFFPIERFQTLPCLFCKTRLLRWARKVGSSAVLRSPAARSCQT